MAQLLKNNVSGVLSSQITAAATSMTLVDASLFPAPSGSDFYLLTLIGLNVNGNESSWEIVKVTAKSSNTLTIVRAQEGTSATAWPAATVVQLRLTAGSVTTQTDLAAHTSSTANPHNVTKTQVGLGNVDNTSDASKPVSTATQTALNAKQNVLVSGTSIKTINSTSLLGSGDIVTGDVTLTGTQTLSNKMLSGAVLNDGYTEEIFTITGTTPILSPTNGSIQTWTLTGGSTPTVGTWAEGQSIILGIDDGSAYTVTWPTITWTTTPATAPTLPTSGYLWVVLWKVGTTLYGKY